MTAQPHAHVRFRRAIERRALWMAEDAAASCRTCRLRTRYSSSTSTRSEARRSTKGRRCAGLSGTSSRVPRGCSTSRRSRRALRRRGARREVPASSRAWPSPSPGEGKRRTPIQTRLPDLLSSPAESSVGQKGPDAGRNAAGRCPPRGSPPLGDDAQPLKEHGTSLHPSPSGATRVQTKESGRWERPL